MACKQLPKRHSPCPSPFAWCEVHPGGKVFLCCPAWLKTSVGNLVEQPLEEIWNGPEAVEIRKTIHNGSFHRCNARRCPNLTSNRAFPAEVDADVESALAAGLSTLPYGPKVLNLCFDHSCNLACPSCRSDFERSCEEERRSAETVADNVLGKLAVSAVEVRLSGFGDPFASPVYRRLLRSIGPRAFPSLQRLHLHTNGQLWTESLWRSMANLHPYLHSAEISVDAAECDTYALNRLGGDFKTLLSNLEFIAALPVELTLGFVAQANNFRQMPALVELARRCGASVYLSQLVNWGSFTVEEFKARAVHLPEHPLHAEFKDVLKKTASLGDVDAGNLMPFAI